MLTLKENTLADEIRLKTYYICYIYIHIFPHPDTADCIITMTYNLYETFPLQKKNE